MDPPVLYRSCELAALNHRNRANKRQLKGFLKGSLKGLRNGGFSVQTPAWTKLTRCSGSRGKCQGTFRVPPQHPTARFQSPALQ